MNALPKIIASIDRGVPVIAITSKTAYECEKKAIQAL